MMEQYRKKLLYPLDSDYIMEKQRYIRRKIIDKDKDYFEKRIAILGGSTTHDIKAVLELFLLSEGIRPIFYESEYNRYYEESVFNNLELNVFKPDIIIVYTSFVNINRQPQVNDSQEAIEELLLEEFNKYKTVWNNLHEKYSAIVIQNNFELPYSRPLGNCEVSSYMGVVKFVNDLNSMFVDYAQKNTWLKIHDLNYLSAMCGLKAWYRRSHYYAYKYAMNYNCIPYVAKSLSNMIKTILGRNKKLLILDLDNTLWGGIIGEDGLEGIRLGNGSAAGEAYIEIQKYVLNLKRRGVLLAVCSKNEYETAKLGFTHPDSILSIEDFVSFKANWEPKDKNIREIVNELNLGLESVVFVDDSFFERKLVKENLPMVSVLEYNADEPFSIIQAIEEDGFFYVESISEDDLNRNESYYMNRQRLSLQSSSDSYEDFLISLKMIAEVGSFSRMYYSRIAQLINKTNQFNLTLIKCTERDISLYAENNEYITLYGRLKDKFGDYGLISCIVGRIDADELHIIHWVMSCRVFQRGMENIMFDALINVASKHNISKIIGLYKLSNRNHYVQDFYEKIGFVPVTDSPGVFEFHLTSQYSFYNSSIVVENRYE